MIKILCNTDIMFLSMIVREPENTHLTKSQQQIKNYDLYVKTMHLCFISCSKQEISRSQTPPHIEQPFHQIIEPFYQFLTCCIDLTSWLINFKISTICIWAKPNQIQSTEPKSDIKQKSRSNKVKFDLGC